MLYDFVILHWDVFVLFQYITQILFLCFLLMIDLHEYFYLSGSLIFLFGWAVFARGILNFWNRTSIHHGGNRPTIINFFLKYYHSFWITDIDLYYTFFVCLVTLSWVFRVVRQQITTSPRSSSWLGPWRNHNTQPKPHKN